MFLDKVGKSRLTGTFLFKQLCFFFFAERKTQFFCQVLPTPFRFVHPHIIRFFNKFSKRCMIGIIVITKNMTLGNICFARKLNAFYKFYFGRYNAFHFQRAVNCVMVCYRKCSYAEGLYFFQQFRNRIRSIRNDGMHV